MTITDLTMDVLAHQHGIILFKSRSWSKVKLDLLINVKMFPDFENGYFSLFTTMKKHEDEYKISAYLSAFN